MNSSLDPRVIRERDILISQGVRLVTLTEYESAIAAFGFKLDRRKDCHSVARVLGDGRSYPSISSSARQLSTDAGFANTACNRKDPGWRRFMDYRREHFCIVSGKIFTV